MSADRMMRTPNFLTQTEFAEEIGSGDPQTIEEMLIERFDPQTSEAYLRVEANRLAPALDAYAM